MVRMSESLYQLLYPGEKYTEEDEDDEEEEIYMKRITVNGETREVIVAHVGCTQYLEFIISIFIIMKY